MGSNSGQLCFDELGLNSLVIRHKQAIDQQTSITTNITVTPPCASGLVGTVNCTLAAGDSAQFYLINDYFGNVGESAFGSVVPRLVFYNWVYGGVLVTDGVPYVQIGNTTPPPASNQILVTITNIGATALNGIILIKFFVI